MDCSVCTSGDRALPHGAADVRRAAGGGSTGARASHPRGDAGAPAHSSPSPKNASQNEGSPRTGYRPQEATGGLRTRRNVLSSMGF